MTTINTYPATRSYVAVDFSFTPSSLHTYTAPHGIVISAPSAIANTPLTFTATTIIYNQDHDISGPLSIADYRWDFGDGTFGYGNPATHTYSVANFQAATKLRVTDSKGRQWFVRHQMYLVPLVT